MVHTSSSNLIYVNSRNRSYGSSDNFTVTWSEDIAMTWVQILSIIMPNTLYNVNSNHNRLTIIEGSNTVSVPIPVGIYNISSLLIGVATELTNDATLTGTYTCTLDPTTQKVVISSSVNFTVQPNVGLAEMLGFTSATSQAGSQSAPDIYDLSIYTRDIYVELRNLPLYSHFGADSYRSIIGRVPLTDTSFGSIVYKDFTSENQMIKFDEKVYINSLDIALIDFEGNPIQLNGVDWSLELAYGVSEQHLQ